MCICCCFVLSVPHLTTHNRFQTLLLLLFRRTPTVWPYEATVGGLVVRLERLVRDKNKYVTEAVQVRVFVVSLQFVFVFMDTVCTCVGCACPVRGCMCPICVT